VPQDSWSTPATRTPVEVERGIGAARTGAADADCGRSAAAAAEEKETATRATSDERDIEQDL
jgi:hypothetical protein